MTKCNNCRAWVRYRYDRVYEDTGRIEKVTEEGGEVWMRFVADEGGELITMWEDGKICEHIMDFDIVPRDPETYKDWQVGDKVHYPNGDNDIVIFRSGELVVLADDFTEENSDVTAVNTCSQLFDRREGRLVLTDIEQKIIEGKKKYEPQDGDIVTWKDKDDDGDPAVSIYKERHRGYATIFANGLTQYSRYFTLAMNIVRPATEEEKQKLFDAMAKEGKRWNAEKKVVEDIPKPHEFKAGEPVLVRDNGCIWKIGVFTKMRADYFRYGAMTNGLDECGYRFCIPYNERTMHLLWTGEDYKEGE